MTALPAVTAFTDATVTEGQFKTALGNLHGYLSGLFSSTGTAVAAIAALGLLGAGVSAKTAAYTILTTDRGKLITGSGTFTVTLPAASTAGAGWIVSVANIGTGSVTVSGAQSINGEASSVLGANQSLLLISTGAVWIALGGGAVRYAQNVFTASGSAVVPSWANAALVTARAGGGGGGGAHLTDMKDGASGGAGGACASHLVTGLTGGASIAVTVGTAGAAGVNGNTVIAPTAGGAGGTTSFGSYISITGGSGGAAGQTSGAARGASGTSVGAGLTMGGNGGESGKAAGSKTPTAGGAGAMLVEWVRV